MKLDDKVVYFIRGLGIGIAVATIICMVIPSKMSDKDVISQAKKLGMVEAVTKEEELNSIINDEKVSKDAKASETEEASSSAKPSVAPTGKATDVKKKSAKETARPAEDEDSDDDEDSDYDSDSDDEDSDDDEDYDSDDDEDDDSDDDEDSDYDYDSDDDEDY